MRNTLCVAVIFGAALTFGGCFDLVVPDRWDGIFGEWQWVKATGGVGGITMTPESEGYDLSLFVVRPNRIRLFKNAVLEVETTFDFIAPNQNLPGVDALLRYAEPVFGVTEQEVDVSGGTLMLEDPCCDLFIWEFSRILPD